MLTYQNKSSTATVTSSSAVAEMQTTGTHDQQCRNLHKQHSI